ncbi:MAG TPA: SAM-dependent chlorinase/fluorinase [Edaphocola sp.]|nr:SAM-dependent chlorinase/fluorinase [Edaphocola sp.]
MIITLLSDFGNGDFLPGIAKGILLKEMPGARIVDLSHDISPHHLLQGCYFLKSSLPYFPEKTVHLSLIDWFVQNVENYLLAVVEGQVVISADNGLLPLAFGRKAEAVYALAIQGRNFTEWLNGIARFLKSWQEEDYSRQGLSPTKARESSLPFEPYIEDNSIACQIIHVDRFGNVVLNLQQSMFEAERKGRSFSINFSRHNALEQISQHYSDVPEGEKLCLFNAGGFMEIAVNHGSAAQLFGLSLTRQEQLVYNKIKIVFS